MGESAQYLAALNKLLVCGCGEVHTEAGGGHCVIGKECVAGNYSYLSHNGFLAEFLHIRTIGKSSPDEQTALRLGDSYLGGEILLDAFKSLLPTVVASV